MKNILLVGVGGFVGSMLRYVIFLWSIKWVSGFPSGTLAVNLAGSLLIGVLFGLSSKTSESFHLLFVVGLCGGFTTFSTFSMDGIRLLQTGHWWLWALYSGISVLGGLLLCIFGMWVGSKAV